MSQSTPSDVIYSLDLVKQVITEAASKLTAKCDGDCSNCPCSQDQDKHANNKSPQDDQA